MADDLTIKGAVAEAAMAIKAPGGEDDILDAHILDAVDVADGVVSVTLQFPEGTERNDRWDIEDALTDAVQKLEGVKEVRVKAFVAGDAPPGPKAPPTAGPKAAGGPPKGAQPRSAPQQPATEAALNQVGRIIAVGSGKGGVGKSSVAVNLALALKKNGFRVGLLDIDIYGPSLPTLLGVNERPNVRGQQILPIEAQGLKLMSLGFLMDDETPVIWRGPILAGIIRQFLQDVDWSDVDYLIVDLPPGTGDAQLSFIQTTETIRGRGPDGAVIVTTPSDLALVDASRGLRMFTTLKVDVLGIVENMAYYPWPGAEGVQSVIDSLTAAGDSAHAEQLAGVLDRHGKAYIFGREGGAREAKRLGTELLGEVPLDADLRAGGDEGRPVVIAHPDSPSAQAFMALAERVATAKPVDGEPKSGKKSVFDFLKR